VTAVGEQDVESMPPAEPAPDGNVPVTASPSRSWGPLPFRGARAVGRALVVACLLPWKGLRGCGRLLASAGKVAWRWLRVRARALVVLVLMAAVIGVWTFDALRVPISGLTVAFIGDSYTGGSDMGGNGERNYTHIVAREMGWNVVNGAAGGSGYVKSGPNARPFEEQQLAGVVAAHPDIVVVVGSRNDIDEQPAAITAAAAHLYRSIHTQLPDAKLLVVGPIWPGPAPKAMDVVRTAVLAGALQEGVPVVDPITDRWFDDDTPGLIGSDGVHPDDAGHQYIAEHMIDVLRRSTTITR
jgi:lysophospholipase L1-like esterase